MVTVCTAACAILWALVLVACATTQAPTARPAAAEPTTRLIAVDAADARINLRAVLAAMASDCARQARCAAAYPDLGARFFAAITAAEAGTYALDISPPPRWATDAAKTLSRSRVVVLETSGYSETTNWGGDGSAMAVAAAFFEDPDDVIAGGDSEAEACLAARTAPAFRVAGP